MPISDLLAQISGQEPSNTVPVKRKAQDGLKGPVKKVPRTSVNLPSRTASPPSRPSPSTPSVKSSSITQRPPLPSHQSLPAARAPESRPAPSPKPPISRPKSSKPSQTFTNGGLLSSLARQVPLGSPATMSAPKKGGYAALMARAQKAQEMRGSGNIQNKPVEKPSIKKEVEEPRTGQIRKGREESRLVKKPTGTAIRPAIAPKASPSALGSRNGTGYKGTARGSQPPPKPAGPVKKVAQLPPEPEKKVKKAALASTGYTGTARPKANSTPGTNAGSNKRLGSLGRLGKPGRAPSRPEPYAAFRSRQKPRQEEEYDSDMDDFIVDDEDDEEEYPGRYQYASEEESDMEAGLDDVWMEEQQAERIAREEDRREEEILRQKAIQKARRLGR